MRINGVLVVERQRDWLPSELYRCEGGKRSGARAKELGGDSAEGARRSVGHSVRPPGVAHEIQAQTGFPGALWR